MNRSTPLGGASQPARFPARPGRSGSGVARRLWTAVVCLIWSLNLVVGHGWGAAEPQPPTVEVTGTVVDEEGRPVSGAKVKGYWNQFVTETSSETDGTFRFKAAGSVNNRFYVQLIARCPDDRLGVLEVGQANLDPVQVVVRPAKAMTVRVAARDGQPVANAEVKFLIWMRDFATGMTDERGEWKAPCRRFSIPGRLRLARRARDSITRRLPEAYLEVQTRPYSGRTVVDPRGLPSSES